jgi:surface antigen
MLFVFSGNTHAQAIPCGQQLSAEAIYKTVPALSNHPNMRTGESCDDVYGSDGWHYQCVEYIRRFFRIAKNVDTTTGAWKGHGSSYYSTAQAKGLEAHSNGGPTRPEPDDILVWRGGKYGHVAIITEVTDTKIRIIEQNWSNGGVRYLPLNIVNGNYTIPSSGNYSVIGWVRKPASNVVQAQATLNSAAWPASGSGQINYNIVGPNGVIIGLGVPGQTTNLAPGQYTLVYQSGGPQGAVFIGVTPSAVQTLSDGGSITFTLNFGLFTTSEVLPYRSSGYRFSIIGQNETPPGGFEQPGFDDSSWAVGTAAFGHSVGYCSWGSTIASAWPVNSRLLVRKSVSLPASSRNVRIKVMIDNDVAGVYFNGVQISNGIQHIECPVIDNYEISVPDSLVQPGANQITYHLYDYGFEAYFDTRIIADIPDRLGTIWDETEASWTGVWTRRGITNIFDATWTSGGQTVTAVLNISITGNQVTVLRRQGSDGNDCDYTGTLAPDGVTVAGTYQCNLFPTVTGWYATIR